MQPIHTNLAQQPYEAPAVVYEASLEVRAGSPFSLPDPLGLTELGD
jgi:hypothetical protein